MLIASSQSIHKTCCNVDSFPFHSCRITGYMATFLPLRYKVCRCYCYWSWHFLCRPMIVIGGSSEQHQEGMGAFQEYPQVWYIFRCVKGNVQYSGKEVKRYSKLVYYRCIIGNVYITRLAPMSSIHSYSIYYRYIIGNVHITNVAHISVQYKWTKECIILLIKSRYLQMR